MPVSSEEQDFIAELKYLSTEEGGRQTPAHSGIRPHVKFPFSNYLTSGQQTFIDMEWVKPRESVTAYIKIISIDIFQNSLTDGMEFEFIEGPKLTGTGKIISVINPFLKRQD
ncbi:MAG TPA: hypothetical protein VK625_01835 [Flavitalea sp.]|nr:hypothetical protein [Flavitalea sp.]